MHKAYNYSAKNFCIKLGDLEKLLFLQVFYRHTVLPTLAWQPSQPADAPR